MYELVRGLPGCRELDAQGRLKYMQGHTHCNVPHPHGHNGTGFMVAGQGMEGCGNYGFPVFDTTEGRVRVWYFPVTAVAPHFEPFDHFDQVHACVQERGWRRCTHLAELWLDEPL